MNVCVGAQENPYFRVGKKTRRRLQSKAEEERERCLFLYAAQEKRARCHFWLASGTHWLGQNTHKRKGGVRRRGG